MKKRLLFFFLLSGLVLMFNSCKKEKSLENGSGGSEGTLQDDGSGDCLPKIVAGTYVVGTALSGTTNYIEVTVDVSTIGSYIIFTDTVNGMYFRTSGVFSDSGVVTIRLTGNGTPTTAGVNNFTVRYGTSECTIAVTTVNTLAVFTLDGSPGACMVSNLAGTYMAGTPLNSTNTVTINVNVTTIGAWSVITDTSNGMVFSGTGVFATTGANTIQLTGSLTPVIADTTDVPVVVGSTMCNFEVVVGGTVSPAVYTVNCAASTASGTYTQNTALTAANFITLSVNVTSPGPYTITATVGNMTFTSAPGASFAAAGNGQSVTLTGSGTPNTVGVNNVPFNTGATACTVPVTVNPPTPGAAVFTINCGTPAPVIAGTYTKGTGLTASNTVALNVNVATAGTYTAITTTATNGMTFTAPAGSFAATGSQTLTLTGGGTPDAAGTLFIPVNAGTAPCSFLLVVNPSAAPIDYFPRTTNSNWSYQFDGDPNDSVILKVIAPTHTALGNVYNIFMGDGGAGFDTSGFFRKLASDYFRYTNLEDYIGLNNTQRVEFPFIKDNVAAGAEWTSATFTNALPDGTPVDFRIRFKLVQKDVPLAITTTATGTITYQNVLIIEEHYEAGLVGSGTWTTLDDVVGYYVDYYARNIGWIRDDYMDENGDLAIKMEVRRWVVY